MKEKICDILPEIDLEIDEIDLYGYDIIETSLSMVHRLQTVLSDLRTKIQTYVFPTKEDEILFFKVQKPEILGRLLFFYKIYRIETQCPNGSDEVIKGYISRELDNLTYFFNRNLDFYQYYRSHLTLYDEYYFVRGKSDLRLCTDSAQFDKDPNFSTGYDYKVAKIIANEMLRIYLNKRLVKLETNTQVEDNLQKCLKYPFRFTGKKVFLIELGYSLVSSGDINNGNVEIKEMMNFLGTVFQVELGDYYAAYIAMKERKKDRTAYLSRLQENLVKRMDEDDSK
ncbi:RteC domain-containing protein [Parabacteroides johnsonii]|uniref:RteC domain-containing protein n=1 Tax=Parabacteroides johnsonii TaxID=387661 RepID=UPI003AB5B70A